jgi:hypothetical protein
MRLDDDDKQFVTTLSVIIWIAIVLITIIEIIY